MKRFAAAAAALVALALGLWLATDTPGLRREPGADGEQAPGAAVSVSRRGGVEARDADLSADAVVRGQVVDEDGNPVQGGAVTPTCLRDDDATPLPGAVALDAEGRFELAGCRARVCLAFSHPAFVAAQPWVASPGREVVLTARPLARLHGRVVDSAGEPVIAARVTFVPPADDPDPTAVLPTVARTTTTDAEGAFSVAFIERPPCGECERATGRCHEGRELPVHARLGVSVRAPGHGPARVELETSAATSVEQPLVVRLPAGEEVLSGEVRGLGGGGEARAYVLARARGRRSEQHRSELTEGNFEFPDLGEGIYDLRVIKDGLELATASDARPGQDITLTADPSGAGVELTARVVDHRGRPVTTATINGGPFRDTPTDTSGEVRAGSVLAGVYLLRVRSGGRAPHVERITVPSAELGGAQDIEIRLPAR